MWHPRRLSCNCLFNARRLWKGVVTAHTLSCWEDVCSSYEGEWRQHTPLSESNTNGEPSWFNSPDINTNFWAGMQWLDPKVWKALGTPKHFTRNPVACFLEQVDKACVNVFATLPRFHKNMLESENLVCSATTGTKTALATTQFWFSYFAASFLKALDNVNVNYLKIPKNIAGRTKRPGGPRVCDPALAYQRWLSLDHRALFRYVTLSFLLTLWQH